MTDSDNNRAKKRCFSQTKKRREYASWLLIGRATGCPGIPSLNQPISDQVAFHSARRRGTSIARGLELLDFEIEVPFFFLRTIRKSGRKVLLAGSGVY
jgi:hypothetical protein